MALRTTLRIEKGGLEGQVLEGPLKAKFAECLVRHMHRFAAMQTQAPNETLCRNEADAGCKVVSGNTHISQSDQGAHGVVGVQGRQNQMPCL